MSWSRALAGVSLSWWALSLGGCSDEPEPKPPPEEGPVLSDTPVWEVEGDPAHVGGCFGRSVAVGDLNGDGFKDLIVVSPPCSAASLDPGRISIFAGQASYFSKTPLTTELTWRNTSPRTSGRNARVARVGNVNGDAYPDVLIAGTYGVSVYVGGPDLSKVFAEPLFRMPGNGTFVSATLVDVNGDGLDDLVNSNPLANGVEVFLSTPTASEPFTSSRVLPKARGARRAGDINGDGTQDLQMMDVQGQYVFYLGCRAGSPLVCDGPLTAQPAWSATAETLATAPDLDGDGLPELVSGMGGGSYDLHLSTSASSLDGVLASAPVWSVMEDPAFSLLDGTMNPVGDMNGDGARHDFTLDSAGRIYLFSPGATVSSDMHPIWAWPRTDHVVPETFHGFPRFSLAPVGDLNGDGYDDLVVGSTQSVDGSFAPGRVMLFAGGRVPDPSAPPPLLSGAKRCGIVLDPEHGKPDLTIDGDAIARSLYVNRRSFAADSCEVREGCVPTGGERRLLRFNASIANLGNAAAIVPSPDVRPDLFIWDECHQHDHLVGFAGYELRDAQGGLTAVGRKQGFALADITRYCSEAPPFQLYDPGTGISPGWADIYTSDIACQWLDITDTPDGDYTLRVGVDEKNIIDEDDRYPNETFIKVRLKGDTVTVLP
ncbi:alpha integrin [Corallococcus sp. H22C18031201]|nr:alpha integrin [Corallococcus sp. H22C18031201]